MNVFMVYAHQDPKSFGSALHSRALTFFENRGDSVVVSDLYASGFHAVAEKWDFKVSGGPNRNYMLEQKRVAEQKGEGFAEDISTEVERLRTADLVIIEFPVWWSAPPAIVKGWLDKVFALGIVWDSEHRYDQGFMRGKQIAMIAGAGDPESLYAPDGLHRATLLQHLFPLLHSTFAQAGFDVLDPYLVYNLTAAPKDERQESIDGVAAYLEKQLSDPAYLYKH